MTSFIAWIKSEPVVVTQALAAGVGLAMAFGLHLTAEQTAAIMAAGQVAGMLISRQLVTPSYAPTFAEASAGEKASEGGPAAKDAKP